MSQASKNMLGQSISAGLQNLASGFAGGVNQGVEIHRQQQEKARQLQEMERDFAKYEDPNTPNIYRASIIGKYAGSPAAAAFIKSKEQQAGENQFFSGLHSPGSVNNILPGSNVTPNVSQLNRAMEVTQPMGQGLMQPPTQQQFQQANVQQPNQEQIQAQQQSLPEQEEDIIGQMTDAQLKEGQVKVPRFAPLFKQELDKRQAQKKINSQERIADRKFEHEVQKSAKKEEQDIRKETQPYVTKILDSYQGSKSTDAVLDQMDNLIKTDNLSTPIMATLMQKMKIPLGVINNPDSEEFDKLSNTLTRDIQKFYGSRILASEFQNFLRQIPTLQNSSEGKKRIIDNLKKTLLPAKYEYQAYKDIIKENGGKRPPNIRELVVERMEPMLDKWAKEFKTDLQKSDPAKVPDGTIIIISPDGRRVAVPKEHVGTALSQGGQLE